MVVGVVDLPACGKRRVSCSLDEVDSAEFVGVVLNGVCRRLSSVRVLRDRCRRDGSVSGHTARLGEGDGLVAGGASR